jgi:hypothetical protein
MGRQKITSLLTTLPQPNQTSGAGKQKTWAKGSTVRNGPLFLHEEHIYILYATSGGLVNDNSGSWRAPDARWRQYTTGGGVYTRRVETSSIDRSIDLL